jgi:hypothetical protein
VVAILLALALAAPPPATLSAGAAHAPLAVFSWCWGTHCGAPTDPSTKTLTARRGSSVHVDLAFAPSHVGLTIAGRATRVSTHGDEISWTATSSGGFTLAVTGKKGWVTYVGRLKLD